MFDDPQWIAFQAMLDERPDSHETRAVIADWLEQQGHPWARGYRWMAKMKKYPYQWEYIFGRGWFDEELHQPSAHAVLPLEYPLADYKILDNLDRIEAEIRLCELFDSLPLKGKEDV